MKKRNNIVFLAVIAGILALVGLAYVFILGEADAPETPIAEPTPAPATGGGSLASLSGAVEIRLNDKDAWREAQSGANIGPGTELRTGAGGTASVVYGDGIRLDVQGNTEIRAVQLDDNVARFILGKEGGLVVADVAPGNKRRVQVTTEGSDAVAETTDGKLHVLADGTGRMQAAVTRGAATLTSNGASVQVGAGYQSTAEAGKAPSAPKGVPASLLLKVKWPDAATSKRRHLLTGTASPGARVNVGGKLVTADGKGRFKTQVDLREGANAIKIFAVDVLGRKKELESPPIVVDTHAPGHAVETSPDMWNKRK